METVTEGLEAIQCTEDGVQSTEYGVHQHFSEPSGSPVIALVTAAWHAQAQLPIH